MLNSTIFRIIAYLITFGFPLLLTENCSGFDNIHGEFQSCYFDSLWLRGLSEELFSLYFLPIVAIYIIPIYCLGVIIITELIAWYIAKYYNYYEIIEDDNNE
jgi:hypothetical protein